MTYETAIILMMISVRLTRFHRFLQGQDVYTDCVGLNAYPNHLSLTIDSRWHWRKAPRPSRRGHRVMKNA